MSTYVLKPNFVLYKDDKMTLCPLTPAFLKPIIGKLGQKSLSIERFPCNSQCPHFNITEDGAETFAELQCTPTPNVFPLTIEKPEKDSTIKLIK